MKKIICVAWLLFVISCGISLTREGAEVRVVTEGQKEKYCQFISIVTGSMSMGASTSHDAESAMNEVRNKVARAGGNAMRIIKSDSDIFATTVVAEALKCTFPDAQ